MKVSPVAVIFSVLGSVAFFAGGMFTGHKLTKEGKWDAVPGKPDRAGSSAITKFRILVSSPHDLSFIGMETPSESTRAFWLDTQLRTIASDAVLGRAVKSMNLESEWHLSAAAAVDKLRDMTEVTVHKGTDVVELTVWHVSAITAAELANAVRDAYVQHREDLQAERIHQQTEKADTQITKQTGKVSDARLKMVELERKIGNGNATPPGGGQSAAGDAAARSDYAAAKYAYEAELQLLNVMREHVMRTQVEDGLTQKPIEILETAKPASK
jgi:hypothetical protein